MSVSESMIYRCNMVLTETPITRRKLFHHSHLLKKGKKNAEFSSFFGEEYLGESSIKGGPRRGENESRGKLMKMDAKNMSLWGGKIDEPAREEGNKNFLKTRETWNRNIKTLKKIL